MVRGDFKKGRTMTFQEIIELTNEAEYAYYLTHFLLSNFPQKKFIIDAGAMQLMEPEWLMIPSQKVIVTPHQKEFELLFGENIVQMTVDEKKIKVSQVAKKYQCIILLKTIVDIVSDGEKTVVVEGGNAGLTKGGTGDTLAGLTASLASTIDSFDSAVLASFIVKSAAEKLQKTSGFWYNTTELIQVIPKIASKLLT
jgi:NAD(P)H-hydrate epimerase